MTRYSSSILGRVAGVTVMALALFDSSATAQQTNWRHDYNAARREAVEKNRSILIDFVTDNCFWCKKLEADTFRNPAVAAIMAERFITLKVDAERDVNLAQALKVQIYPTVILASVDGRITGIIEGYVEPLKFLAELQRVLGDNSRTAPDWMARDLQEATKAIQGGNNARAIALLKPIVEEYKDRPVQSKALQLLREIEQQAEGRLARAKQMEDRGQMLEAMDTLTELLKSYPNTPAANEATTLLTALATKPEIRERQRARRARELLAQAREEYRTQQFLGCLERCELLVAGYGDTPEGTEAAQMAADIRSNPEWMAKACSSLNNRLSEMYIALAEAHMKKGDSTKAMVCLEKVQQMFPGSSQAQLAQVRLAQLQGRPAQITEFKKQP
jgi:thioredoxin-related protein